MKKEIYATEIITKGLQSYDEITDKVDNWILDSINHILKQESVI